MNNTQYFTKLDTVSKPERCLWVNCERCGGSGFYYTHGICFKCKGQQKVQSPEYAFPTSWSDEQCAAWDKAREERNRKARERAQAKRIAEREARKAARNANKPEPVAPAISEAELRERTFAENVERCPKLREVRKAIVEHGAASAPEFVWSVCDQAFYHSLSDKQVEAFNKACNLYLLNYGD